MYVCMYVKHVLCYIWIICHQVDFDMWFIYSFVDSIRKIQFHVVSLPWRFLFLCEVKMKVKCVRRSKYSSYRRSKTHGSTIFFLTSGNSHLLFVVVCLSTNKNLMQHMTMTTTTTDRNIILSFSTTKDSINQWPSLKNKTPKVTWNLFCPPWCILLGYDTLTAEERRRRRRRRFTEVNMH